MSFLLSYQLQCEVCSSLQELHSKEGLVSSFLLEELNTEKINFACSSICMADVMLGVKFISCGVSYQIHI